MTIAQDMYIRACIIGNLIIYRIKTDINSIIPFEGMITFSIANWITINKEERVN